MGVRQDEHEELLGEAPASASDQYSSMSPSSAKKSWLAKIWHGFDSKFMKPLLTSKRPSLMETMPDFCRPCAQFLTSAEQRGLAVPINDEVASMQPHTSDIEVGSLHRGSGGSLSSGD